MKALASGMYHEALLLVKEVVVRIGDALAGSSTKKIISGIYFLLRLVLVDWLKINYCW